MRVSPDDKSRLSHRFIVYKNNRVQASKLPSDIRDLIRQLEATSMQLIFIDQAKLSSGLC